MSACKKIPKKPSKICTGDLNKRVTLYVRNIVDPEGGSVDYNEDFTNPQTLWARIDTVSNVGGGVQIFDGANVVDTASHLIYIRFIPNVTFQEYLDYDARRFRIIDVTNLNEEDEFLLLRCTERGDNTKQVNWS